MRRRRRKLEPMPAPIYITLAEVRQRKIEVPIDLLVPQDKQRIAQLKMHGMDDLPPEVRERIANSKFCPDINYHGTVISLADYAVKLLDNGLDSAQIVKKIDTADEGMAQHYRSTGVYPPKPEPENPL